MAGNRLIFQILEMDERLRGCPTFIGSSGWKIISSSFPAIEPTDKIIAIRGQRDDFHIDVVMFDTRIDLICVKNDILMTFAEWSEFLNKDKKEPSTDVFEF